MGIYADIPGLLGGVKKKVCEHPAIARMVLGDYARKTADEFNADSYRARIRNTMGRINKLGLSPGTPLAIPAGVAELFSYRLAESIGVKVPRVLLRWEDATAEECATHYVKRVPGGYVLSERVPRSIPLYFLRDKAETLPGPMSEKVFRLTFVELFDKRCPLSREAYSDFPEDPPAPAREAARWDSEQRLMHYIYRAFLHCTYPHTSNALVDIDGNLWLIDFEKTYMVPEGEDDIELLHRMVKDSSEVVGLCQRVSGIRPLEIERAFADIPSRFWRDATSVRLSARAIYGAYNTPEAATQYFADRLSRWQEVFGHAKFQEEQTASSAA
jgi:hypothetical protein